MKIITRSKRKFQPDSSQSRRSLLEQAKLSRRVLRKAFVLPELPFFVCDECSAPLHLYGANFIETYTNGKVNILRCLCDLHAQELGLEVAE